MAKKPTELLADNAMVLALAETIDKVLNEGREEGARRGFILLMCEGSTVRSISQMRADTQRDLLAIALERVDCYLEDRDDEVERPH